MTLPAPLPLRAVRGEILHFLSDPASHGEAAFEHFAGILMDGKAVAARVDGGRFVVDGVSSGRHTLSWQSEEEAACGSSFGGRVRKIVGCGWRSWVPFF